MPVLVVHVENKTKSRHDYDKYAGSTLLNILCTTWRVRPVVPQCLPTEWILRVSTSTRLYETALITRLIAGLEQANLFWSTFTCTYMYIHVWQRNDDVICNACICMLHKNAARTCIDLQPSNIRIASPTIIIYGNSSSTLQAAHLLMTSSWRHNALRRRF